MTAHFEEFDLHPAVQRGLKALGFERPTPVQQHTIPLVLAGRDALVQAKTGSGKTLAFGLPLLSLLAPKGYPQALVVVPTRELAIQVCEAIASIGSMGSLKVFPIYGGVSLNRQEEAVRRGVDLVVGTPGRLKDLLQRGTLNLGRVRILVLDEADQMLDMGFRRDIEHLMGHLPQRQQTLILSATMPKEIEAIAHKHLKDPAVVKLVQQAEVSPREISHYYLRLKPEQRLDALIAMLEDEQPDRAIIFTQMKHETKRLALKLEQRASIKAGFLNGNMSQNARNTMLDRFRSGEIRTLVATDVAARGLDIEGVSHVFHYAVPTTAETYIHRSGRTGRNGSEGKTVIMVTADGEATFKVIQKKIACEPFPLDLSRLPAPDPAAEAEPARAPRQGGGRNRQAQATGQGNGRNRQSQTSGHGGDRNRQAQASGQGGGRNRQSQASEQPARRR